MFKKIFIKKTQQEIVSKSAENKFRIFYEIVTDFSEGLTANTENKNFIYLYPGITLK